jgi:hypothetical protein
MFKPVERLGTDKWANLLAADLGFVYFRNCGIYLLAEKRAYEFSYEVVIEGLGREHKLSASEVDLLLALRARKVAYRRRDEEGARNFDFEKLLNVFRTVSGHIHATRIPPRSPTRLLSLRYATLRDAEAKLLTLFDVRDLDRKRYGEELSSLWNAVRSPRDYSWYVRHIDKRWIIKVDELIDFRLQQDNRCRASLVRDCAVQARSSGIGA